VTTATQRRPSPHPTPARLVADEHLGVAIVTSAVVMALLAGTSAALLLLGREAIGTGIAPFAVIAGGVLVWFVTRLEGVSAGRRRF
jgi:hypothetical protein